MDPTTIVTKCLQIVECFDTEKDLTKILAKLKISRGEYIQYLQPTLERVFSGGPVIPIHIIAHISEQDFKEYKNMPKYAFATYFPFDGNFHVILFECQTANDSKTIESISGITILKSIKNVNSQKAMDEFIQITADYKAKDPVKVRDNIVTVQK